jgi:fructan beta-fructosidase
MSKAHRTVFSHSHSRRKARATRLSALLLLLIFMGAVVVPSKAASQPETSAFATDPEGWIDIMPSPDLRDWSRVPIPPTGELGRAQWHVNTERNVLICDGDGGHDMLLLKKVVEDAILHVEFRYTRIDGVEGYNSGVYIRNSSDGAIWHQAQFGDADGGFVFGVTPTPDAKPQFFYLKEEVKDHRVRPAGQWNTLELTAQGKTLTLWINGAVTCRFDNCGVDRGHVGLEAEGYRIEFRNLRLKELSPNGNQDDLIIADFEGKGYEGWKIEGTAFGKAPAKGTLENQMHVSGFEGKGLVNSFLGGDGPTGKLTSPEFAIERDYIKFLIGGGGHKGKTCMNLLIDGEVVLSTTGLNTQPGGSEFLNWENWDVREFKSKEAVLQIVDQASGGWGHINVDQITQSNTKAEKKPAPAAAQRPDPNPHSETTQIIEVTGKYILFPVSNEGQRGRMTIYVGDQLVHNLDCDFPPSSDAIDWWSYLDMEEYMGRPAKIIARAAPEVCKLFESSDEIRHLQPLYDEALRPQFHMSQMRGWNNDPNGMFYYDGEYHFFWQCNPAGRNWANMYWGHATSPDMVHWTEQDRALRPFGEQVQNRHPKMAVRNCFSGSGNVDRHNTAGWQEGNEKTLVLAFTDTGCGEALAYSNDRGKTWQYYEGNPVIRHQGRDPKLMWYEPGQHWVIAVYDEDEEHGRNIAIYTSRNLTTWKRESSIPGYFECAEIFELPVDGNPSLKKWVIFAADAEYAVGHFDGRAFTPEHEGKHRVHWGNYYASQCFSSPPDDRVVQIGWARINMPNMPFNQTFTVPTRLTLRTTEEGIRMFATPIKELEQLRRPNPKLTQDKELTAGTRPLVFEANSQHYDIVATLKQGSAAKAVLQFGESQVTYDFKNQKLDEMPLRMQDGQVSFRVLVDRPICEVIGGGGACFKTSPRSDMGQPLGQISLTAEGGSLIVESFKIYEMASAWKSH